MNNDESFPYLLDLWNPQLAFHDFGTGGYGTLDSLSVYDANSSAILHKLVLLAYYLGNDLRDNLGVRDNDKRPVSARTDGYNTSALTLKGINSTIRQNSRVYNLLYSYLRAAFGGFNLPPRSNRTRRERHEGPSG